MKYRFVHNLANPNRTDASTTDRLKNTILAFYKVARMFREYLVEDPGVVMPAWVVNDRNLNFFDNFAMIADAVSSYWKVTEKGSLQPDDITVFVINGLVENNYYILFSDKDSISAQEDDILNQLKIISAKMVKDILQKTWDSNG